ncbi:MAG: delta-aminolevulinic acid dehydratase [Paludibacteraceae bacterium]|nr:delta-aminolevulinic acid dehydratase [Paludibacteraceae bacterium]
MEITDSFNRLREYCEAEDFKGWDPYDGLNSKLFQALPLLPKSALCRLAVIQGMKRCPLNLRRPLLVPKQHNPKGLALFLQGYCNLYNVETYGRASLQENTTTKAELLRKINHLAELLLSLRSKGDYHGACWGYNFDWQARRLFLFPAYTPTVVATSFAATALIDAYEITQNRQYLDTALSSAQFVLQDLHRTPHNRGFLFSYSPLPGNDTVFNASLLGSRLLSYCYRYTNDSQQLEAARMSVRACCDSQKPDGSWVYGMLPVQSWVDSFHTGYNLDALAAYQENTNDLTFQQNIDKGFTYYIKNFFMPDGTPRYYNDKTYPIDIHCPGQLFITLARLHKYGEQQPLADSVMNWTLKHMQDEKGYFYYQIKPHFSSHIPYMRWSNAFMFCALSYYLLNKPLAISR